MTGHAPSNYPPSTYDADPSAPWNAPEPWEGRSCGDCDACLGVLSAVGVATGRHVCVSCVSDGEVFDCDPSSPACEGFRP